MHSSPVKSAGPQSHVSCQQGSPVTARAVIKTPANRSLAWPACSPPCTPAMAACAHATLPGARAVLHSAVGPETPGYSLSHLHPDVLLQSPALERAAIDRGSHSSTASLLHAASGCSPASLLAGLARIRTSTNVTASPRALCRLGRAAGQSVIAHAIPDGASMGNYYDGGSPPPRDTNYMNELGRDRARSATPPLTESYPPSVEPMRSQQEAGSSTTTPTTHSSAPSGQAMVLEDPSATDEHGLGAGPLAQLQASGIQDQAPQAAALTQLLQVLQHQTVDRALGSLNDLVRLTESAIQRMTLAGPNQAPQTGTPQVGTHQQAQDVMKLLGCIRSSDPAVVQGALAVMKEWVYSQHISAAQLLHAGIMDCLMPLIHPSLDETACLALEAVSALLNKDDPLDPQAASAIGQAVPAVVSVLRSCVGSIAEPNLLQPMPEEAAAYRLPAPSTHAHGHGHMVPASLMGMSAEAVAQGRKAHQPLTADNFHGRQLMGVVSTPSGQQARFWSDATEEEQVKLTLGQFAVGATLAGVAVLRMARVPQVASLLVQRGVLRDLCAGLRVPDYAVQQVCLLALYRLSRAGSHADNLLLMIQEGTMKSLLDIVAHGPGQGRTLLDDPPAGWRALCADKSNSRNTAAATLLDMSLVPDAPAYAAAHGMVQPFVKLLEAASHKDVRMYSLLVLARLANRSPAVQLDTVREGAVPALSAMMSAGTEEEALHAARLIAILAQSQPTHSALTRTEVIDALIRLLSSSSPMVVEHACSVFAIMAQNLDTHFAIVGWGLVPILVKVLEASVPAKPGRSFTTTSPTASDTNSSQETHTTQEAASAAAVVASHVIKMQTYVLATFSLLAMHETRHADVICRAGAVPHLVALVSRGEGPDVREYAAAVLNALCHSVDIQEDVITAGGVPALAQLLRDGGPAAQGYAAEALAQLAVVDAARRKLIVKASEILESLHGLLCCPAPASKLWGMTLLNLLCQDDSVLSEAATLPGFVTDLAQLLQDQQPLQSPDLKRAQVQGAWMVARLCDSPHMGSALAGAGMIRPLMQMLSLGWESVQRGAGGALHVMMGQGEVGALGGLGSIGKSSYSATWNSQNNAPAVSDGDASASSSQQSPKPLLRPVNGTEGKPRALPLRIEPMDSNGHAAAVAALLALCRCDPGIKEEVQREMVFQQVWVGRPLRLDGLSAPALS